jgi:acetylornithine deacetylase/succinyl-diaminopimelate desuccinylase-like protein
MIQDIAADSRVQEKLAAIATNWPDVVAEAIDIQQVPSPTFDEEERAQWVEARMVEAGFASCSRDEINNVYGLIPGESSDQIVVVSAHLDTVFPPHTDLRVRRENGRVHGPGISDNSLGVAGLLALGRYLLESEISLSSDVWLAANVGEEGLGNLRGMRAVAERFGDMAQYIVLEGGVFGHIFHAGIGVRRYEVTVTAPGGHSWGNFGNSSAIHCLGQMIARISQLKTPRQPKTTFNVGQIEGGTSVNSIAQRASMLLDLRSEDDSALEQLIAMIEGIAQDYASLPDVEVTMKVVGDRPSGSIPRNSSLVHLATEALHYVGCETISYDKGSTDANVPLSRGWSSVCIGLTQSANAHRLDEYMETEPLASGLIQLFLLTVAAAGIKGST